MSVDLTKLTAHLSPEQQEQVKKLYHRKEENSTAAFLWCFFFGTLGAHRFYLRQWGRGFARLAIPLLAVVVILAGIILRLPQYAIIAVAIVLLGIALVWEVIDLFRIDHEIYEHNLRIAEGLIAQTSFADTSIETDAIGRMHTMMAEAAAAPAAAVAHEQAIQQAAGIEEPATPEEPLAQASEATYMASTRNVISEEPEALAKEDDFNPAHSWSVSEHHGEEAEAVAAAGAAAALVTDEAATRAHVETDHSVTDSLELHSTEAELAGTQEEQAPEELAETEPEPAVAEPEAADENITSGYESVVAEQGAPGSEAVMVMAAESANATQLDEEPSLAPQIRVPALDVTDMGYVEGERPIADIGTDTNPLMIAIPRDMMGYTAGAAALVETEQTASDAPLAEPETLQAADYEAEPLSADTYAPPVVPVSSSYDFVSDTPDDVSGETPTYGEPAADSDVPHEETVTPWEAGALATALVPAAEDAIRAEPQEPSAEPEPVSSDAPETTITTSAEPESPATVAEGASAAEQEAAHHMLRRVRVVRQVKVNGQVTEETFAEEYIDPDADPEPVRARLREKLHIEALARQAQEGGSQA